MNRITKASFGIAILALALLISVGSVLAQKSTKLGAVGSFWVDTAINPHDFIDEYYAKYGIISKEITGRRTGYDGLSVIGNSSNPYHTNVRVIATMPAYNQNGDMLFWYPLGELQDSGFTLNAAGEHAQEVAKQCPVYVFPKTALIDDPSDTSKTRQAALMDDTFAMTRTNDNPLGLREIRIVNYTESAFTKESLEMMNYFGKKNGMSADDTPIIRTMEDLNTLLKNQMITADAIQPYSSQYAIGPIVTNLTSGAIARDAFISMATKYDRPLPTEDFFVWQFYCLQKTGTWCMVK